MRDLLALVVLLFVQMVCAAFIVSQPLLALLGIEHRPISWELKELLEIGAAIGLTCGAGISLVVLRRSLRRQFKAEEQLRQVSGAFMELMQARFTDWALTSAERDVALFAIKGMSTQEIAVLRGTAEGTVKAQTNAIYRKAGVSGRPQLLSLFIEDLMSDGTLPQTDPAEIQPASEVLLRAVG